MSSAFPPPVLTGSGSTGSLSHLSPAGHPEVPLTYSEPALAARARTRQTDPMTCAIRPARPEDAACASKLIARAYAPWRARLDDLPNVTAGVAADIGEGGAWVAVLDGVMAGIVLTGRHDDALRIKNIAVSPEFGGQGIGRALMDHVETRARIAGFETVRLATHKEMEGNVAFYKRLGWAVSGTEGNKVKMQKSL